MFLRQLSSKLIERGVSADTKRQAKISDLNGCRLDIGRHLDTGNCFRVNADPGNRVCGICNLPNILVDDAFDLQQGESYRSLLESKPTFLEGPGLVRGMGCFRLAAIGSGLSGHARRILRWSRPTWCVTKAAE
jgi:hypothetical protein